MLPLKLKMSAFCSYLNETTIDFTKFGKKGLYLITGDTGAGKTTIFDAISYALYGEASGDLRDPKLFRSKNAAPELPTYVELTFMSKGTKYMVRRNPEYERPKRGGGTTKQSAEIELTIYDGDNAHTEKLKKNDNRITEIIGIDTKKFKQLSMIAQGAFMRVLNADTAEKTEILRAIFSTERFSILQEELKALAEKYRRDHEVLTNGMISRILQINCSENSAFAEETEQIKDKNTEVITNQEQTVQLLNKIIGEDQEKLHKTEKDITVTAEKMSALHTAIGKAEEREKRREQYLVTKEKLKKARQQLPLAQEQYDAVTDHEKRAGELEGQQKVLQEKLPEYARLERLRKELQQTETAITVTGKKAVTKSAKLAELVKTSEMLKKEREKLTDAAALCEKVKAASAEYETRIKTYRTIFKVINAYKGYVSEHQKALEQYKIDRDEMKNKQQKAAMLNTAFLDEQAGIIAESLMEGKPCPVCGSVEHPKIAHKREDAPSKQQVELARKQAEEWNEKASASAASCSRAEGLCNNTLQELEKKSEELYGEVKTPQDLEKSIEAAGKELRKKIDDQQQLIEQYNQQIERMEEINQKLPEIEKEIETTREEAEKLKTDGAVFMQKQTSLKESIILIENTLPFQSRDELDKAVKNLSKEALLLRQQFKAAEKNLNECISQIKAEETALKSFGQVTEESEKEEIRALKERADSLKKENDTRNQEFSAIRLRMDANRQILQYIEENMARYDKLQELYLQANELSNTANGKLTGGKDKITLEVFAQARYFDSILSLANLRLLKMSNGKYEFCRSEQALEKRSKSGLDIDVIDHDSATKRSVKSLSGGESFMASLSLALGFSDVIQSTVSGVHLETMFIDEGFGTLDEKALENAYRVFSELSNEGRCLVGIISHVEDLKSRISNRIVVTKDAAGNSHIRIETETMTE